MHMIFKILFQKPKTCPLLDVSEIGSTSFPTYGKEANITNEVAQYKVYRYGELVESPTDISHLFNDDMVSF